MKSLNSRMNRFHDYDSSEKPSYDELFVPELFDEH